MHSLEISIIVPIYNVEKYLRCCLESILAQTFSDFECILVDDCSPDNCPAICDEYILKDSRMKVIHKTKNQGLPQARKSGLEKAMGKYIQFVDSDDWIEPDMLEKMYKRAASEGYDIVYCDFVRFGESELDQFANIDVTNMTKPDFLKNLVSYKLPWNIWNKLVKRKLFDGIVFPEYQNGEDAVIVVQLFCNATKIGYENSILYHWYVNHESLSFSYKKNQKRLKDVYLNFIFIFDFLKKRFDPILLEPELSEEINNYKWLFIKNGFFRDLPVIFRYPKSNFICWFLKKVFATIKKRIKYSCKIPL